MRPDESNAEPEQSWQIPTRDLPGAEQFLEKYFSNHHLDTATVHRLVKETHVSFTPPEVMRNYLENTGELAKSLFERYAQLQHMLSRHEATIHGRWRKKSPKQRRDLLQKARPNIPTCHRPDFEGLQVQMADPQRSADEFRHAYMLPYINTQDLSKPHTLPLLLNSRKQHPSIFATTDLHAMLLGIRTGAVKPPSTVKYTRVILDVDQTGDDYGRVFDDLPAALRSEPKVHAECPPSSALLLLEAQNLLWGLLVDCCRLILHDISPEALLSEVYPQQPDLLLDSESELAAQVSWTALAVEAPYRTPTSLSISRLEGLLGAATEDAENHLWTLREDPGYFYEELIALTGHFPLQIKTKQAQTHPIPEARVDRAYWHYVLSFLVWSGYIRYETTHRLWHQSQRLKELQAQFSSQIRVNAPLPEAFMDALLYFRFCCRRAAEYALTVLEQRAKDSEPLRKYESSLRPGQDANGPSFKADETISDPVTRHLLWLLRFIWDGKRKLSVLGLLLLFDELQHLLEEEQTAADLITTFVGRQISTIAIYCECLRQVEMYQPWAGRFDEQTRERITQLYERYYEDDEHAENIVKALEMTKVGDRLLDRLVEPTRNQFNYPVERRRTKENVEQMRLAEANLDTLWAGVDEFMRARVGDLEGSAVRGLLSQSRALQRTPEWSPPPKKGTATRSITATKPLSELYYELELRSSKTTQEQPAATGYGKKKVKTRRPDTVAQLKVEVPAPEPTPTPEPAKIHVDERSLKVFRTLFFQPSPTALPGEIAWKEFVHALTSVGLAAQKLYGSVWQFSPTESFPAAATAQLRSLHFHESHPGKIPFNKARRHGRRLTRAYGWEGSMFVLREK